MSETVLKKVVDIINADPHSGLSLNLYALVSTLRMEKSGYMYMQYSDDAFVITDHYFCKTRDNILNGSKGSLLFLSPDGKSSYQIKGTFQYHRDDEVFEQVRNSMPPNLPSRAAVILKIDSVYSGSEKLC